MKSIDIPEVVQGDLIVTKGFWEEIQRIAEANAISAKVMHERDDALIEWHLERLNQLLSKTASALTQSSVRKEAGEWKFHL